MALSKIAVGIDPSPLAETALRWASDLASTTGAGLRAIGTWQMPLITFVPTPLPGAPTAEFMQEQCTASVKFAVAQVGAENSAEVVVLEGKPGPTLLAAADDADLLVVGRTGQGKRKGFSRLAELVLGSTARHCVHHSAIPVVAVPDDGVWKTPASVVIGLDGSDGSHTALDWVLSELPADTQVHVVRAFEPWVGDGLTPLDMANDEDLMQSCHEETMGWVEQARARTGVSDTPATSVDVTIGVASDALLNSGFEPDLIVVGERGHTGLAARALGSVADHMVRYAPCPVVVVPTPG